MIASIGNFDILEQNLFGYLKLFNFVCLLLKLYIVISLRPFNLISTHTPTVLLQYKIHKEYIAKVYNLYERESSLQIEQCWLELRLRAPISKYIVLQCA